MPVGDISVENVCITHSLDSNLNGNYHHMGHQIGNNVYHCSNCMCPTCDTFVYPVKQDHYAYLIGYDITDNVGRSRCMLRNAAKLQGTFDIDDCVTWQTYSNGYWFDDNIIVSRCDSDPDCDSWICENISIVIGIIVCVCICVIGCVCICVIGYCRKKQVNNNTVQNKSVPQQQLQPSTSGQIPHSQVTNINQDNISVADIKPNNSVHIERVSCPQEAYVPANNENVHNQSPSRQTKSLPINQGNINALNHPPQNVMYPDVQTHPGNYKYNYSVQAQPQDQSIQNNNNEQVNSQCVPLGRQMNPPNNNYGQKIVAVNINVNDEGNITKQ